MAKKNPLDGKPQWFKDMMGRLRGERKMRILPPEEFLEHACDEAEAHPEYLRALARTDIAARDRAMNNAQQDQLDDDMAIAEARKYIKQSLFPDEVLAKLGLDPKLDLGWDRAVSTVDATPEEREKAIAELERKKESWIQSIDKDIAAIKRLDEMAGSGTLRDMVDDAPDEYGTGGQ